MQFVHGAVSGFCEKEGVSYEGFASKLSLAEYKQLKQSLSNDVLQAICRDGITREEVCVCALLFLKQSLVCCI